MRECFLLCLGVLAGIVLADEVVTVTATVTKTATHSSDISTWPAHHSETIVPDPYATLSPRAEIHDGAQTFWFTEGLQTSSYIVSSQPTGAPFGSSAAGQSFPTNTSPGRPTTLTNDGLPTVYETYYPGETPGDTVPSPTVATIRTFIEGPATTRVWMQYPATTIATLPENPNPVGFTSTYTIPPNPLTFTTWIGTNTLVITEYLPTDTDVATRTTANGGVLVTPAPTPTIVYEDQGTTYTVTPNETGGEALQTATFTYTDGDNTYTYTVRPGETGGLKPITVTQLPITVTLRPDPATYCPPSSPSVTSQPTPQPTISGNILVPPTPFEANPTFNFILKVTTEVARLVIVDSGRLGDGGQYDLYINGQLQGTSPLQPASNTHICTDQDTVAQCELWGASVLQYWLGRDTWNIEIVDSRSHLPFDFFVHGRGYYYVVED